MKDSSIVTLSEEYCMKKKCMHLLYYFIFHLICEFLKAYALIFGLCSVTALELWHSIF